MEFQDRILKCVDCSTEFIWTAGEQQFFADKNFKNEPKRCKACKSKRAARPAGAGAPRERVETVTTCSACGKDTFEPSRVLEAMGALTHGNVRIGLHPGVTDEDVRRFIVTLPRVVAEVKSDMGVYGA